MKPYFKAALWIIPAMAAVLLAFSFARDWRTAKRSRALGLFSPDNQIRAWSKYGYDPALYDNCRFDPSFTPKLNQDMTRTSGSLMLKFYQSSPVASASSSSIMEIPFLAPVRQTRWQAQLGTATLALVAIGTHGTTASLHVGETLPISFFNRAMQPLTTQTLKGWPLLADKIQPGDATPYFYACLSFPSGALGLKGYSLWDARTHEALGPCSYGKQDGDKLTLCFRLKAWTQRPARLVLCLAAYGSLRELPCVNGTDCRSSFSSIQLANIVKLPEYKPQLISDSGIELKFTPNTPESRILAFFHSWPREEITPFSTALIDSRGDAFAVLDHFGNCDSGIIGQTSAIEFASRDASMPLEKELAGAHFQIRLPERYYRVVFDIPSLPGLPPPSSDNLFDQRVPYAKFPNYYAFEVFLMENAQIRISAVSSSSTGYEFRNATLAEMTERLITDSDNLLKYDPKTQELSFDFGVGDIIYRLSKKGRL